MKWEISMQKNNKKNQKKLMLVISLLILLIGLTGCGNKQQNPQKEEYQIQIGALKGPTFMGLLFLQEDADKELTENAYDFQMLTGADELAAMMIQGKLDIALVPANLASILYHKTKGEISVIDVNPLGVLYMVSGDTSITSMADLKGKTIYLTGKGTTPDYVLQYLLQENQIALEDCHLEYKSEATEITALLAENPQAVGLLPQPFATVVMEQKEGLSKVLSFHEEWNKVQGTEGSSLVTGVTVAGRTFLEEQEEAVVQFLKDHSASTNAINEDLDKGSTLCVNAGLIPTESIAMKAIPECNITCITGTDMKQALEGYLQVLFEMDADSIGGSMPEEDFYYVSKEKRP